MSIIPLLMNLEMDAMNRMADWDHYLDDDFGFGIHPELFRTPRQMNALMLHPRRRYNPYGHRAHALMRRDGSDRHHHFGKAGSGEDDNPWKLMPFVGKDGFQVSMDVSQFKPNELTVKTVDRTIVVEGKHEEREDDHGMIQRHFVRKYTLPKDYDPNDVVSTVSSDGVLTVKATPPPNNAIKQNERIVQIQQTGPAHMSIKAPEQEQSGTGATAAAAGDGGKGAKQQTHNGAQTQKAGGK